MEQQHADSDSPGPQRPASGPPAAAPVKVLTSGMSGGVKIEVLEYQDGSLAIAIEGAGPQVHRWGPDKLEACINAYLRLLRV